MVKVLKKTLCIFLMIFFLATPLYADTVSMSFSNVPVGYLFQNLGKLYGVSFSISSAAAARVVSVEITDVEFDKALEIIAASAGVTVTESGKGVYIVRALGEETEGVSQEEKKRKEQEKRLQGAVMESVTTKFVGAKEVQEALEEIFDEDFKSLVSVSQLAGDDEKEINYNSIVIYASSPEILATVKDVIAQIDRQKPMVEMEALFIELTMNDNKDIGANWDVMTNPLKFQEEAPAQNPDNDPMKYFTSRFGQFWRISPWEAEATIDALHGTGSGRVLANPKVRVMSGRKATFVSETQMPIMTKDGDGEINTEWKNVGISLEMLPVVLDDGEIHITVTPRASSIVGEKRLGEVSAPIISERRVETEMLLHPEETIVIGGLINDRDIKSMSKVPVLGDIPLFGELFKSTNTETERSTVVVFLRPTIVEPYSGPGMPAGLAKKYDDLTVDIKPIPASENILVENDNSLTESAETSQKTRTPRSDEEYERKWQEMVESLEKKASKESEKAPEKKLEVKEEKKTKEPEAAKEPEETNIEVPDETPGKGFHDQWIPPLK
jgi:type IV pilus assembly protein PilQ